MPRAIGRSKSFLGTPRNSPNFRPTGLGGARIRRPPRIEGLSWAHYRILTQLQDPDERAFYEQLAAEDSLSATRLARKQLAVARTVVVNTRKYDIHRRYVAHVFYAFNNQGIESTFLKGRYLNQELINKGFAKLV